MCCTLSGVMLHVYFYWTEAPGSQKQHFSWHSHTYFLLIQLFLPSLFIYLFTFGTTVCFKWDSFQFETRQSEAAHGFAIRRSVCLRWGDCTVMLWCSRNVCLSCFRTLACLCDCCIYLFLRGLNYHRICFPLLFLSFLFRANQNKCSWIQITEHVSVSPTRIKNIYLHTVTFLFLVLKMCLFTVKYALFFNLCKSKLLPLC